MTSFDFDINAVPRNEMLQHLDQARRTRMMINRVDDWIFDRIKPHLGRRVLEFGSGHGNFVRQLTDRELVMATDHEPSAVAAIKHRFTGQPNVRAQVMDICHDLDPALRDLNFDTVLSVNTLEHIHDDALAVKNAAQALPNGGKLVSVVPAHMNAYGNMDASIGHYRRYSKRSLAQRITAAGFRLVEQFYVNFVGLLGWFVNGRVLARTNPSANQLNLFNYMVPALRAIESLVRPPVGLSLVSVASIGRQPRHA